MSLTCLPFPKILRGIFRIAPVTKCEIQTKPGTVEHIDWRIENVEDLAHKLVELPEEVSARLKKMLSIMELNFGAVDLIKDETGTYTPDLLPKTQS